MTKVIEVLAHFIVGERAARLIVSLTHFKLEINRGLARARRVAHTAGTGFGALDALEKDGAGQQLGGQLWGACKRSTWDTNKISAFALPQAWCFRHRKSVGRGGPLGLALLRGPCCGLNRGLGIVRNGKISKTTACGHYDGRSP